MGINIFYKVRARKDDDGKIIATEKGLLRLLKKRSTRDILINAAINKVADSSDEIIYASYVWDVIDGTQIAYFGKSTAIEAGWERR